MLSVVEELATIREFLKDLQRSSELKSSWYQEKVNESQGAGKGLELNEKTNKTNIGVYKNTNVKKP